MPLVGFARGGAHLQPVGAALGAGSRLNFVGGDRAGGRRFGDRNNRSFAGNSTLDSGFRPGCTCYTALERSLRASLQRQTGSYVLAPKENTGGSITKIFHLGD